MVNGTGGLQQQQYYCKAASTNTNGSCYGNLDCEEGYTCSGYSSFTPSNPGTCTKLNLPGPGAQCYGSCESGYKCSGYVSYPQTPGTCVKRTISSEGGPCESDVDCGANLRCESVTVGMALQSQCVSACPSGTLYAQTVPGVYGCISVNEQGVATPCNNYNSNRVCQGVNTGLGIIGTDPESLIESLFGIILSLSGGIALILIIISGYRLMTSQGNPEGIKGAREQLTAAIVGLLFIIFSIVILQIIGYNILHIPGFAAGGGGGGGLKLQ